MTNFDGSNSITRRGILLAMLLGGLLAFFYGPTLAQEETSKAKIAPTVEAGSQAGQVDPTEVTISSEEADASEATGPASGAAAVKGASSEVDVAWPLIILGGGIVIVLGLIIFLKVNAFIALIIAAVVVSLFSPGDWSDKIGRVANAFGSTVGGIGIVIALAAVIGKCMLDSGAADRIVRVFVGLLGEKRAPFALMSSGFVLAVPVFFDTVFYLLIPLARSLHRRTGKEYLKYILAIAAGGAITHSLVPPTPGPLMMASNFGFDVGWMIMIGMLVAAPGAVAGLIYAGIADRLMKTPMREIAGQVEPEPLEDSKLPSLGMSLLPVLLPVLLISINTVMSTIADGEQAARFNKGDLEIGAFAAKMVEQEAADSPNPGKLIMAKLPEATQTLLRSGVLSEQDSEAILTSINENILGDKNFYDKASFLGVMTSSTADSLLSKGRDRMKKSTAERMNRELLESAYPQIVNKHVWKTTKRKIANISSLFGNANLALLISTIIALWMLLKQRGLSRIELAQVVETALMSGGVIILITAGGGAFGAMLKAAEIGPAIQEVFRGISGGDGTNGFVYLLLAFLLSSVLKVAQGSGTVAMIVGSSMMASMVSGVELEYHVVYLACAVGAGSMVGSWMNDSGFWIFAKMGGLTEAEALKSWTIMLIFLGLVSFGVTVLLSQLMPLV